MEIQTKSADLAAHPVSGQSAEFQVNPSAVCSQSEGKTTIQQTKNRNCRATTASKKATSRARKCCKESCRQIGNDR